MKKFGSFTEQVSTKFRTSGDSKEVALVIPSTLTGASNSFTLPLIAGTADTLVSRVSLDQGALRLQNKDLSADNVLVVDATGAKKLQFDVALITGTKVMSLPDVSGTVVYEANTATLTNKVMDGDNNTFSNILLAKIKNSANLNVFLQRNGSGVAIDSVKAVPAGDVIGSSDTQALTNKTINADANTITNIEDADIKAAAAIAVSKLAALTVSRALVSDVSGFLSVSAVTSVELGYVSGVTSAIQTQINGKQGNIISTEGDVILGNGAGQAARLAIGGTGTVLTSNGTTASWSTPAGTGDVTSAAVIADNALVRGDGGAKGIQQATAILVDDLDNITGIGYAQALNGYMSKVENTSSFTITDGYAMVRGTTQIKTGTTITVPAAAYLDILGILTVVGTLDALGTVTIR